MTDDFVNQLTLNCLISKQQLQKLNKKTKENIGEQKLKEIQEYSDRIKDLFQDLLVCQSPADLLFEVKVAFDTFLDKSIYYFKARDNSENLEKERHGEIQDDIDFEKEEREMANGNYTENEEEIPEDNMIVMPKCKLTTKSKGVEDIQQLPLDWFQNVRHNYRLNKIISSSEKKI